MMCTSGELVGLLPVDFRNRIDFCVVNTSNAAQFLFDLPSKLLSAAAVREPPCSARCFIENSADHGHQTEDGVRQSKRAYPGQIHHEESRRKQPPFRKSAVAVEERFVRGVGDGVGHKTDVASPQWCSTHMRRAALNSLSSSPPLRHRISACRAGLCKRPPRARVWTRR